jgi:hypothetical protein
MIIAWFVMGLCLALAVYAPLGIASLTSALEPRRATSPTMTFGNFILPPFSDGGCWRSRIGYGEDVDCRRPASDK